MNSSRQLHVCPCAGLYEASNTPTSSHIYVPTIPRPPIHTPNQRLINERNFCSHIHVPPTPHHTTPHHTTPHHTTPHHTTPHHTTPHHTTPHHTTTHHNTTQHNPQPVQHGQDGQFRTTHHKANVRLIAHNCNKNTYTCNHSVGRLLFGRFPTVVNSICPIPDIYIIKTFSSIYYSCSGLS